MTRESQLWFVIGKDNFAAVPGGLNRYVEGFIRGLRDCGVNVEPVISSSRTAENSNPVTTLRAIAGAFACGFRKARSGFETTVINSHFALYGAPFLVGFTLRNTITRATVDPILIVHFHGPWAVESDVSGKTTNKSAFKLKRAMELFVLRRAEHIVVLSDHFKELVVGSYGVASTPVHVVPPGLDARWVGASESPSCEQRSGSPAACLRVLMVRRLTQRMGILETLALLESFAFRVDGRPVRLQIAGQGALGPEIAGWIDTHDRHDLSLIHI